MGKVETLLVRLIIFSYLTIQISFLMNFLSIFYVVADGTISFFFIAE